MTLYALRDDNDGLVHLARGDQPVGTVLCGKVLPRWYPLKSVRVSEVCAACAHVRRMGRGGNDGDTTQQTSVKRVRVPEGA
jgi:hypothetical protein